MIYIKNVQSTPKEYAIPADLNHKDDDPTTPNPNCVDFVEIYLLSFSFSFNLFPEISAS